MPTPNDLQEAIKTALKAGDKLRVSTLRLVTAALKQIAVDERREPGEDDVLTVVQRQAKQRRESIDQYRKGNRPDLVEKEEAELGILEELLPQAMSDDELEAAVRAVIAEKGLSGAAGLGVVMKEVMARHRGRVDGKKVQEVARRLLAG